ncbi:hypothetical protein ELH73_28970 [Rhizobium leguminosarum]|uniref:Uncharacterized protein n=1 Tax=Rhizobium leguminosarum TaxID=384 RepID=A0ABD7PK08_RHILE|nr:hypothetical protein ELI28_27510 [Rhizobium leguminosarum]TAV65087.1 hypothetical protein ELI27_30045 [Rhizobium leguminosarum]TAW25076.1 hypothetical protein ELI19_26755 [Rhizobium leguminosarum]TAW38848.1 hypothetical protein ELI18_26725 [Rhizobium leguminosarum]TAX02066.1 hypothetical protein ELI07_33385 [Rhizobium leguminosarum]
MRIYDPNNLFRMTQPVKSMGTLRAAYRVHPALNSPCSGAG